MEASKDSKTRSRSENTAQKDAQLAARVELHTMWKDLVQTQRIHEMIKCLQAEKQKLKILHNIEPDSDFLEFASQQQNLKQDGAKGQGEGASEILETKERSKSIDATGAETIPEVEKERRRSSSSKRRSSLDHVPSSSRLDAPPLHRPAHISSHARSAAEVLSNKRDLTDQEFEDIVELCEDKIEQKALREAFEEKRSRERYLQNAGEPRVMLYNFINSKFFVNFMLITIITSIVGIFLLTFETISIRYAWPLIMLDSCIIGIFLAEAIMKIIIYKEDYFMQLWNLLDMLIIIVHFLELAVDLTTRTLALSTDVNSRIIFKFLKSLRALRLLRVIKFLPNLQVIVATVFQSMLSIGSIAVLMLLFMFVFAVMGRGIFSEHSPKNFGNLWLTFVTLFQLLTLDNWFQLLDEPSGKLADEEEFDYSERSNLYWALVAYLFAYLVFEYFVFLNLFVAVLVDNFQLTLADAEIQKQKEALEEEEAQRKFEELKKEGIDPSITEAEHQRHRTELEQLGMHVEDYFPVDMESSETELLSEFYKDLNSLDFERFLWKRRFTLFNMISDTALNSRATNTFIQEEDGSSDSSLNDDEVVDAPVRKKSSGVRYHGSAGDLKRKRIDYSEGLLAQKANIQSTSAK